MPTPSTGDVAPPDDTQEPAASANVRASRGATVSTVNGQPAPRLPHERDESSDSGSGEPREVMRRAHDDVVDGKTPTDKGEATDAVYRRSLRGTTPGRERD